MSHITRRNAADYADHDDCLTAAAEEFAEENGLEYWEVTAAWEDDQRDVIVITSDED